LLVRSRDQIATGSRGKTARNRRFNVDGCHRI
jgi:hypothetical protein